MSCLDVSLKWLHQTPLWSKKNFMWRVKLKGASPLGTNTLWLNLLYKRPEWIIGPLSYFCPAETSALFLREEQSPISFARPRWKWGGLQQKRDAAPVLFLKARLCAEAFRPWALLDWQILVTGSSPEGGQAAGVAAPPPPPLEVATFFCICWGKTLRAFCSATSWVDFRLHSLSVFIFKSIYS